MAQTTFARLQRIIIGHGLLMLLTSLIAGLGLWISLLGGFELLPGTIAAIPLGGSPEAWARAHRGIPMNALMVIAIAFVLPGLGLAPRAQAAFAWIFVGTGWANIVFYLFSIFAKNRGLSFGPNTFGPGETISILALAPAYVFGAASMVAIAILAWRAFGKDEG